jgi:hypothetical protein
VFLYCSTQSLFFILAAMADLFIVLSRCLNFKDGRTAPLAGDDRDDEPIEEQIQRIKSRLENVPVFYRDQIAHSRQMLNNTQEQLRAIRLP